MFGERQIRRPHVEKNGFRWRGTEITRLEALSDAVFGFAITLLVVSLQVPDTFTEMLGLLRGLPAFAASFALLFLVWLNQHRYFRRYGLVDGTTTFLNALLLFVILFFVYPLKFVFQIVIGMILGPAWYPDSGRPHGAVLEPGQQPMMMMVFGAGYVAVFGIFVLLNLHAYRQRDALELDEVERFETRDNIIESGLNVGIGVLSLLLAGFGGPRATAASGMCYWLVGPAMTINGFAARGARKRLKARLAAAAPRPAPVQPVLGGVD
jgi:Endosomal/lysosomal potassium channel TMEM175